MTDVWALAALWFGLALIASLVSICFRGSTALTEIIIGIVAQLIIGAIIGSGVLSTNDIWVKFLSGTGVLGTNDIWVKFLSGAGAILLTRSGSRASFSRFWEARRRPTISSDGE